MIHPTPTTVPVALALALLLAACAAPPGEPAQPKPEQPAPELPPPPNTDVADDQVRGEPLEFFSPHLDATIVVLPGVFPPQEAQGYVLPFMQAHPQLFAGKRVYEIGTGSGLISLYAARLGASKVVCTDISEAAIASVRRNAEALGLAAVIDARLVSGPDTTAFAACAEGEQFDTIISNPPYALDLDATHNTALVDKGDLGFSLVRGLAQHMAEGGCAALFYHTLFYHEVMVKFARWSGYQVRSHVARGLSPWAMEALFNMYLRRLLVKEGLPPDAFRFYRQELPYAVVVPNRAAPPLIGDGPDGDPTYQGFLVITR